MTQHPCFLLETLSRESMITSEDEALVTLQHRTALACGQFWKLKEQLRSRDTSMKSRLALLHVAVMLVLLWAAETWTPSVELFWAIRFVYGTTVQRMEGRRRRPGERWLEWLGNLWRRLVACESNGFPRAEKG